MIYKKGTRVTYIGDTSYARDNATLGLMETKLEIGKDYIIIDIIEYLGWTRDHYAFKEILGYYPSESFVKDFRAFMNDKYGIM